MWPLAKRTLWWHRSGSSKATRVGSRVSPAIPISRRSPAGGPAGDRGRATGTRAVFEDAIAGKFRLLHLPVELGGIGAIKRAVMCDAGLGCISRSAVEPELRARQLRLVHTPWLDLRRQITLLVHRQKYIDRGLRKFPRFCGVALTAEHDATSNIPFAGRGSDGGNRGTRSDVRPASGGNIRPHRDPKRDSRYSTGHTLDSPR